MMMMMMMMMMMVMVMVMVMVMMIPCTLYPVGLNKSGCSLDLSKVLQSWSNTFNLTQVAK